MTLRTCARGLLAGATVAMALAGGTGIAHASPDPALPPIPPSIDEWLTEFPTTFVNPMDEGGPATDWDGVGMYCENIYVRCS